VFVWRGAPGQAVDGLHYASLKQSGLYYVFTTRHNVSPSFALELLVRLAGLFKDYCGVLNEESIRKNFVLIYELLDEVLVRRLRPSRAVVCIIL
jgi:AP-4 complex subunit mu-1